MKKSTIAPILVALLLLIGCKLEGRIYNLTTGKVTTIDFSSSASGKGKIRAVLASGEKISGKYVTFVHPPVSWGTIHAAVYGGKPSGAETGESNQYGIAVISGNKGFAAACDYVTTTLVHGFGACRDNQGTTYELIY